ncbi:hypothetical protein GCM10022217_29660 [Chryseobacterium ginsenosidimutans]|uniref:hypothetical protein n=1 Tax=Chryseobacterium ginsenosidimutans TaxID=687846 RepID=UPI0031CF5588
MNNIFEFEIRIEEKIKIYLIVFFAILISFFIIREYLYGDEITNKILLDSQIHSKVIRIYKNRDEHNFTFVKYSNGKEQLLDYPYQVGDSVSKNKGDSIEYVFRNNKVIKNNWLTSYLKNYKH